MVVKRLTQLIVNPLHSDPNGLTALETCAKYGAPLLFTAMCESEGIIKTTVFRANRKTVFKKVNDDILDRGQTHEMELLISDGESNHNESHQNECGIECSNSVSSEGFQPLFSESVTFDVSMYETLSILGRQSILLRLLTFRNVQKLSKDGAKSFLENRMVRAWIKKKQYVNYLKTFSYIIRFCQLLLALGMAVISVFELDHLPFTLQYLKLITEETSCSTGCTNTTAKLGKIKLDSCALAALMTLKDACKNKDVNVTNYLTANNPGHLTDILLSASVVGIGLATILVIVALINICWSTFSSIVFLLHCLKSSDRNKVINFIFATRIPGSRFEHALIIMSSWMMVFL